MFTGSMAFSHRAATGYQTCRAANTAGRHGQTPPAVACAVARRSVDSLGSPKNPSFSVHCPRISTCLGTHFGGLVLGIPYAYIVSTKRRNRDMHRSSNDKATQGGLTYITPRNLPISFPISPVIVSCTFRPDCSSASSSISVNNGGRF